MRHDAYSPIAKALHWIIAVCVVFLVPAGVVMANVPGLDTLYNLHRSVGALVMGLMAARVGYRLVNGAPAAYPGLGAAERFASGAAHAALYALLIAVPVAGWAGTSAYGAQIMVFGLFELPPIMAVDTSPDKAYALQILNVHKVLALTMTAIAVVHIVAALRHHFIKRDGVLRRML
ncbi:MAG: cytochrome b [Hyphomicrobiales bacterium]|nr:cytochrome b [Hyphomicrobiales bacterium]